MIDQPADIASKMIGGEKKNHPNLSKHYRKETHQGKLKYFLCARHRGTEIARSIVLYKN